MREKQIKVKKKSVMYANVDQISQFTQCSGAQERERERERERQ